MTLEQQAIDCVCDELTDRQCERARVALMPVMLIMCCTAVAQHDLQVSRADADGTGGDASAHAWKHRQHQFRHLDERSAGQHACMCAVQADTSKRKACSACSTWPRGLCARACTRAPAAADHGHRSRSPAAEAQARVHTTRAEGRLCW